MPDYFNSPPPHPKTEAVEWLANLGVDAATMTKIITLSDTEADKHWQELLPTLCSPQWKTFYSVAREQGDSPLIASKKCIQLYGNLHE